jgi:hypothetical protein
MNHLPKSEQRTLRTSWITYDDLLKSMEKKRKLQSKMVSFCGYLIFIISVCVTSVLAVTFFFNSLTSHIYTTRTYILTGTFYRAISIRKLH